MENHNSIKNQEIKGQFIHQHVYGCVSPLVEYIIQKSYEDNKAPLSYDEIGDSTYYEDSEGKTYTSQEKDDQLSEWQEEIESLENEIDQNEDQLDEHLEVIAAEKIEYKAKLERLVNELEDADEQFTEIYEWWMVSRYLSDKLLGYSQIVITDGLNQYWGRCTTGQAILLDYVIGQICFDMEILEGQSHAWLK